MKKAIIALVVSAALGASAVTFHRSFKNGYPAGSAPSQSAGASVGVNAAKGKEKPKDDGTCWAVTANGTRCKNHKDGEKGPFKAPTAPAMAEYVSVLEEDMARHT